MRANPPFRINSTPLIVTGIILVLLVIGYAWMGQGAFVRTTLSGLTIASLYFMIAAGLTLIFGLMDVLNFAQGGMFMVGAYLGWQFYTNPSFIFGIAPLIAALLCGLVTSRLLRPIVMNWRIPPAWQERLPGILTFMGLVVSFLAVWGLDVLKLSSTAMVAAALGYDPLSEIKPQEPLSIYGIRLAFLVLGGGIIALGSARPGDVTQVIHPKDRQRGWIITLALLVLAILLVVVRDPAPRLVLYMNGNLRFFLALFVGTLSGAGLGAVIEISLIRPLYIRPFYQILVTLGLAYVLREMIMLLWKPLAYQMSRPPMFAQPGEAANLVEWFLKGNSTIDILGVTFPTYRLFIILLGLIMIVVLGLTIGYSRLGMIIRAGVQDREMVEALGINVRQVFTIVFMIGAGLAALGGIGAAPYIPVEPNMGDAFQLQGFICVVIGGMGSFPGAAVGALLLGLARAFGDYLALKFNLSPAIAEASTVIIMAIVLLVRPAGLFGRKD
ncbi:MAG TPA: branched-chain amino acid ABC transporter permease [Anaerolineaceae bacterium]